MKETKEERREGKGRKGKIRKRGRNGKERGEEEIKWEEEETKVTLYVYIWVSQ